MKGRMQGLFRSLYGKFSSLKKPKNKYPITHIEGAENLLIDSSVLCCPVCYSVYSCVPTILKCGHTFCGTCVQTVCSISRTCQPTDLVSFRCPLCREEATMSTVVKNFLVEDLLKNVEELCADRSLDNHIIANIRITKERYEKRCCELEQANNRIKYELEERKKNERKNYACIAILFSAYLLLTSLFG